MSDLQSLHIHIDGLLEGVGFRPFVYNLAESLRVGGWIRSTPAGADITVEGAPEAVHRFVQLVQEKAPPLAHIDAIRIEQIPPSGSFTFQILPSAGYEQDFQPLPPDIGICEDCRKELFDPADRRYRYPFISCANCGPRFSILEQAPYQRGNTAMAAFEMCEACAREYNDPANRRYHAHPIACETCGPQVWLEIPGERDAPPLRGASAIEKARQLIAEGRIVAIKDTGGYRLLCDAANPEAVAELRRRKRRPHKPFAVIVGEMHAAEQLCRMGQAARDLLNAPQRPVVVLERRPDAPIAPEVAPAQNTLGVMLPYTALHHLLLESAPGFPSALVITSGNPNEEPLVKENAEARRRLAPLAAAVLMHDLEIQTRCHDSVVRVFQGHAYPLRRARGYVPSPLRLAHKGIPVLATGGELKSTFCLTNQEYAFPGQHIHGGENQRTLRVFAEHVARMERLFHIHPEAVACDLHPGYLSTRYARERAESEGLPLIRVQHHHAHIVSCMAEHQIPDDEPVIGVTFDRTGYSPVEGETWGGEFLLSTYTDFQRAYHLDDIPLPGGEQAVRHPWRQALAWLERAGIPWTQDLPPVQHVLRQGDRRTLQAIQRQMQNATTVQRSSSVGLLFDAVASLIGIRHEISYTGQAAMELEARVASHQFGLYPLLITGEVIDPVLTIRRIVDDLRDGVPQGVIVARFHNTIVMMVHEGCRKIREERGIRRVVLSGCIWQNATLLGRAVETLRNDDFEVCFHRQVPPNDGGLALGQAVIAMHRLKG